MPVKKMGPEDWTPERVTAFWDHWYSQEHVHRMNFSRQVGRGITRYLTRRGVLRGDVLDFSCGWGDLAAEIIRRRRRCWGCDWSATSVRRANELLSGRPGWQGAGLIGDPGAPHAGRAFDLVTCVEVVEHVPEKAEHELFAGLRDATRNGGLLFMTTPNEEDLDAAPANVYCPFCDATFHHCQHVRAFDQRGLAATISRHGFRVVHVEATDFTLYQAPEWPGWGHVDLRYAARVAAALPPLRRPAMRRRPAPHLCALAVKE